MLLVLYYIFILGLGFISTIALIVIIPIIMNKKAISEMKERVESYKNTKLLCDWKFGLGILFFMFFCMYASAPIEQYDALSKHLPITLYAARTGQYYINLIESGVYCESMVSQYGFSAAFLILGAQKALVLFNVVLMFLCIGGGYFIFSQLEPAIVKRKLFWFVGIATIPLLFEVSTIFYIDILPVFFLMISFGQLFDFNLEKIWLRMSAIAFCLGSAFFTKMTSAPYILVLGIVVFACGLLNYCKGCVGIFKLFKKYFKAIGLFIVPFIGSCFYIGYMTGNPVYYFFNSLFGSPYASMGDYADPFINPIGLNFKSLFSIVFNTSQNIELKDGALGLFLLGTVLLPVYVFWKKSKKILIWFILTLMMYQISCVFSYNLRYKYELCEIILCDVNKKLKDVGITVMDGPFFSIMPFGKTGYHSLTSVTFTPHITSYDSVPTFECQGRSNGFCSPGQLGNCNDCPAKPESAWPYMSNLAKKYMKEEYGFEYKKSLFSMKPILKASEIDDSRPTVIKVFSTEPTFVSVLSGKINTVYDLDEVLNNAK